MKAIPEDYKITDGFEMIRIIGKLTKHSMVLDASKQKVTKKPGITPQAGCDFILGGCSVVEKRVYEVNALPEITVNHFVGELTLDIFCYCLPENELAVKQEMKDALLDEACVELDNLKELVATWEEVIADHPGEGTK